MSYTPHILIVDDEPRICDSIKSLLAEENYNIFTATNGYDALAFIKNSRFDLVLLDLIMPEMDGHQIMAEIHRHYPELLIIILTGHASIKSAVNALKKGAYDYLRKPFEIEDLLKTIQNALDYKKTGTALIESEIRFREMADLLPTIICETDVRMRITYINKAGIETFGYSQEEIEQGIKITDLLHPEDVEKVTRLLNQRLKNENTGVAECRILNKDSMEFIFLINPTRIIKDEKPNGLRISCTDFTEHRRLYTRLQQALKIEAVASLSGGIAHEFNNALMGINGNIELLEMLLPVDKGAHRHMDQIMSATSRMAGLTSQLLAYAREGKYRPQKIFITDIITSTLTSLQQSVDSSICIETDLTVGAATAITADLAQMQMMLSAVMTNAVEAVKGAGTVKITAVDEVLDDTHAKKYPGHKNGAHVILTIRDNGQGMDKETRDKVFEPFFTTKFQGRGLSMAAVYGIVKSQNGWIDIESEPNKGTYVTICLPVEAPVKK